MTKALSNKHRRELRKKSHTDRQSRPHKRESEEPADSVALEARSRQTGLPLDQCKDPRSATFIGRLNMKGELSNLQYDALQKFIVLHGEYLRAQDAPNQPKVSDRSTVSGGEPEDYQEWVSQTKALYRSCIKEIHEGEHTGRLLLWDVISKIALSGDCDDSRIGELRLAANVLVHHFGLDQRRNVA